MYIIVTARWGTVCRGLEITDAIAEWLFWSKLGYHPAVVLLSAAG